LEFFPGDFYAIEDASKEAAPYIFAFMGRNHDASAVFMPPENVTALLPDFGKTENGKFPEYLP